MFRGTGWSDSTIRRLIYHLLVWCSTQRTFECWTRRDLVAAPRRGTFDVIGSFDRRKAHPLNPARQLGYLGS